MDTNRGSGARQGAPPTQWNGKLTVARSSERGDETRRRIIDAARLIAAERGYRGTTLAMIQKAAGVHPGSLYWLFDDKDALFAALVESAYAETRTDAVGAGAAASNPVKAALDAIVGNPARHGLWRFNVSLMLDADMADSRTGAVIRRMREDTQQAIVANWLEHLPADVIAGHPDLPRRLAEHSLVTVEGCLLARVAGRLVDEDAVTAAAASELDRMVIDACLEASVEVPGFVLERHSVAERKG